ncbi:MAG TPA: LemA family protein [Candidatus Woesearchaeota archaeon]|nr:LemA family protein [Candidatus Woesearchaeota archaeon]
MVLFWGLAIILLIVVVIAVAYINRIIVLSNRIDNSWAQIDVQLKKRSDLVPNLIETVKGYTKYEKGVLTEITKARTEFMKAKTPESKAKTGNMLAGALKSLFAVSENYPKLQASENFKMLQEELAGIENKIAYARQFYNDSVLSYNNLISTIPGVFFARTMNRTKQKPYLEIEEAERKNVKVSF